MRNATYTLFFFFFSIAGISAQIEQGISDYPVETETQEWQPGVYMGQALNNTLAKAVLVNQQTDFKFREGITFLAAFLDKGEEIVYSVSLKQGQEYVFIGGGDDDVSDCNLYLRQDGMTYKKDVEDDNTPVISFTPQESGEYKIVYELAEGKANQSFVSMVIMVKNAGYDVSADDLDEAINGILKYGELVDQNFGVKIHDYDNQWGLFGALLRPGTKVSVNSLDLGDADHYFVAAGPSRLQDADLQLIDQESGEVLQEDRADDPSPAIGFSTQTGKLCKLSIANVKSNGPSVIITLLLTE